MPTEQRVIVGARQPLGQAAGRTTGSEQQPAAEPPRKKKSALLVLVGAVVALALAAAAYLFVLAPPAEESGEEEHEPVALGEVLHVDPVSLNLAGGRYLRLGIALQLVEGAGGGHGPIDTARALDQAIALFSGRDIASVTDPAVRDQLKAQLAAQLADTYHGEVVDIYFTEYVTQ